METKKKSKGMSPTQLTMRHLRRDGGLCAVVEKWNQHAGEFGIRQDLFGIIDILLLDHVRGVVGIQACAGSGLAAHWKKLTEERAQETMGWLKTPGTSLEIWAWRKLKAKRGGKAMVWQPKVKKVTLADVCDGHSIIQTIKRDG